MFREEKNLMFTGISLCYKPYCQPISWSPLLNNNPTISVSSDNEKLNKSPRQAKCPDNNKLDIITTNLLSHSRFCPLLLTEQGSNIYVKTAWNRDCKSLVRQEGIQVCWSPYLFSMLKEIVQKDIPIFSP